MKIHHAVAAFLFAAILQFSCAKDQNQQLIDAIRNEADASKVESILKAGADPNYITIIEDPRAFALNPPDRGRQLPRAIAFDILLELWESGKNQGLEMSPLIAACATNNAVIVRLLLESGADPDLQTSTSVTALMAAAVVSDTAIVKLLLDAGADPRLGTSTVSPLMLALTAEEFQKTTLIEDRIVNESSP